MDRALELGLNFFDTANVYGWKIGEGWTEQILGRWFAQGGGRREKVVLATKVCSRMGDWPMHADSRLHVKRACEELAPSRLHDLYQMHRHRSREPGTKSGRPWNSPGGRSCMSAPAFCRVRWPRTGTRPQPSLPRHRLGAESPQPDRGRSNSKSFRLYGVASGYSWSARSRLLAGALTPATVGHAPIKISTGGRSIAPAEASSGLPRRRTPGRCGLRGCCIGQP